MGTMLAKRHSQRAFTLLEVMVALVIVALGMMAVNSQLNRFALTARYMEEKTLASWIGSNELEELSVDSVWPEVGDRDDELEFANRLWHLSITVSTTDVENLRRVDVDVSLSERPEVLIHRTSGLIEPPVPGGFVPVRWAAGGAGG